MMPETTHRSEARVEPPQPYGKRIVLVNGEPLISRFVSLALQRAQHEVLSADDADKALAMVRRERPDLVLVDVWLSGAHDLDLVRQLVKLGGPPVVILSDAPIGAGLQRALDAGAVDYISSPTSPIELLERVQRALGACAPGKARNG